MLEEAKKLLVEARDVLDRCKPWEDNIPVRRKSNLDRVALIDKIDALLNAQKTEPL